MKYPFQINYIRIEDEIIKLSSAIQFSEEHLMVYSLDIADLIIRCSVELETIVKEIFYIEKNERKEETGEILKWIEDNWNISQKEIRIVSPYFEFESLRVFSPFDYKKDSVEDYYTIYNSIKHNKSKNLKNATMYSLIRVLGALFVAETYYENKTIDLGKDKYGDKIDRKGISKIFEYLVAPCKEDGDLELFEKNETKKCIYRILKKEGKYGFNLSFKNVNGSCTRLTLYNDSQLLQKYSKEKFMKWLPLEDFIKDMEELGVTTRKQFEEDLITKYKVSISKIKSVYCYKMEDTYYAELNKYINHKVLS